MPSNPTPSRTHRDDRLRRAMWHLLLLPPFIGVLWVPFFNAKDPELGGIPFFYWYQFVWIAIGAALTGIVYLATREAKP